MKDTSEQPGDEYTGQALEGSPKQGLLSLWSWGMPPFWHMGAFTNLRSSLNYLYSA